jgi:4-cresol dehydrogenase (hydroxylating) flavoprotein subunit
MKEAAMTVTVAPDGVSLARVESALEEIRAAIGAEHVHTGAAALEFRDPFWPTNWDEYESSAVVQPDGIEEIQAVLRIANENRIPVWTVSTGRNNGLGGGSPRVKGSIVMNLRRMDRILEINDDLAYAVVEPGVTWNQLAAALREGGHRLMVSATDLGWGSVIGNSLEHGTTYLPYGADFMAPCGMEVVLANGEVLRTGMGALPGSKAWHTYKRGLGPTLDPLFMQSNFGVVVRMGIWLMPYPEVYAPAWAHFAKETDLIALMDTLRSLRLDRTLEGVPNLYNTVELACLRGQRTRWYDGDGPTPDHIIDQIAADLGIGRWTLHAGVWDDRTVAEYKIEKITAALSRIDGAMVHFDRYAPEDIPNIPNPGDRVLGGEPNLDFMDILGWYGKAESGAHAGTGMVAPLDGKSAYELHTLLRTAIETKMGLDYLAYPLLINARSYIHIFGCIFDAADDASSRQAYQACRMLIQEAARAGYGEYRSHIDNMDLTQGTYSFGDHAYRRFAERIKDAVDPNGILAPGKQGIWPASYRADRG